MARAAWFGEQHREPDRADGEGGLLLVTFLKAKQKKGDRFREEQCLPLRKVRRESGMRGARNKTQSPGALTLPDPALRVPRATLQGALATGLPPAID